MMKWTQKPRYLFIVVIVTALGCIRAGEYVIGHFFGDRDGAITTPFLVMSLAISYTLLLSVLTILVITFLSSWLTLQESTVVVILLALLLTAVLLYKCWEATQLLYLTVSMHSSVAAASQVFYDIGNGVNEQDSARLDVGPGEAFATLRFPLSKSLIRYLRFDPLDRAGQAALQNVQIMNGGGQIVQMVRLQAIQPLNQIKHKEIKNGVLLLESAGNDPRLFLAVTYPITSNLLASNLTMDAMIFYGFGVLGGMVVLLSGVFFLLRRQPVMRNILKRVIQIGTQTILIALISLIGGELTLRVYHYFHPVSIFYSDSYSRFRGKPFGDDYDFKLNSQGFKDVEFTAKREHIYRVLGIGDSFAYSVVPYKSNYLTLLESQLRQQGLNVEILNMGIPGIGPREYLAVFGREGLELNPDMALLSFFIGNDFIDSELIPYKRQLYSVASLIHYLVNIKSQYQGKGGFSYGIKFYCDTCPAFNQETYLQIEYQRSFIYIKGEKHFIQLFDEALFYLVQIHDICQKKGVALVVIIIPDELQINPTLETEIKIRFYPHLTADGWDITLPNDMLTSKLKSLGIDYLDLYPYFERESKQQQLYRPRDSHWNIAGNQLAANVIQDYLGQYIKKQGRSDIIGNRQ
jgi:hypothetical protein